MRGVSSGLHDRREGSPLWRRLVLALTLLAFAQAGYVTQTHIHPQALASRSAAAETQHGKTPARDDPQHCPLCQEYLVAGAYRQLGAVAGKLGRSGCRASLGAASLVSNRVAHR